MSHWLRLVPALLLALVLATPAWADEELVPDPDKPAGLVPFVRGGYLHQFAADIHDGARYSVDRTAFQAGPAWIGGDEKLVALAFGYRFDGYKFSGDGFFGQKPWSDVDTLDIALPIKWPITKGWTAFCIPMLRSSKEHGAAFEDSIVGGGLIGAWWTCARGLKIGPGVGIQTQLDADPAFFPVLLIDWQMGKGWSLETGSGLGATQGPGLVLKWKPDDHWDLSVGARYDRLRFRLDGNGVAPGGVGEDTAWGALVSVRYWFGPMNLAYVGLGAGLDFAGDLTVQDAQGRVLASQSHEPSFTLGFMFGIGF